LIVQGPAADRVGTQIDPLEAERRDAPAQLVDCRPDVEQRHHADADQPPAVAGNEVNEAKSAVARPEERKFLGFSISNDGSERRIAPKALDKFKTQIRDLTRRTRGISLRS
jgi:hypothetical protein